MNLKLRRAEQILEKKFWFIQSQEDDLQKTGQKIMTTEDIEYLIGLKYEPGKRANYGDFSDLVLPVTLTEEQLLELIEIKKTKGFAGIELQGVILPKLDPEILKSHEYFIEIIARCPVLVYIFFSKAEHIKFKISRFQNLLAKISDAAKKTII